MVIEFDHNLVMAGIPSSKVTLRRSLSCMKEAGGRRSFSVGDSTPHKLKLIEFTELSLSGSLKHKLALVAAVQE